MQTGVMWRARQIRFEWFPWRYPNNICIPCPEFYWGLVLGASPGEGARRRVSGDWIWSDTTQNSDPGLSSSGLTTCRSHRGLVHCGLGETPGGHHGWRIASSWTSPTGLGRPVGLWSSWQLLAGQQHADGVGGVQWLYGTRHSVDPEEILENHLVTQDGEVVPSPHCGGELLTSNGDIVEQRKEYVKDLLNPTNMSSLDQVEPRKEEVDLSHTSRYEAIVLTQKKVDCGRVEEFKFFRVLFTGLGWFLQQIRCYTGPLWQRESWVRGWSSQFTDWSKLQPSPMVMSGGNDQKNEIVDTSCQNEIPHLAGFSLWDRGRSTGGPWSWVAAPLRQEVVWASSQDASRASPWGGVWACPTGRRPQGRPRTPWTDYISWLTGRSWLGRSVWASLLRLRPPKTKICSRVSRRRTEGKQTNGRFLHCICTVWKVWWI